MFFTSGRGFYAYNAITFTVLHTDTYLFSVTDYEHFFPRKEKFGIDMLTPSVLIEATHLLVGLLFSFLLI